MTSGRKTSFRRKNNVYVLDIEVVDLRDVAFPAAPEGRDLVRNVERLTFADGVVVIPSGVAGSGPEPGVASAGPNSVVTGNPDIELCTNAACSASAAIPAPSGSAPSARRCAGARPSRAARTRTWPAPGARCAGGARAAPTCAPSGSSRPARAAARTRAAAPRPARRSWRSSS